MCNRYSKVLEGGGIILTLLGFLDEKSVHPILILVNYHYKMSEKGVLGFSISYLVLEIFRLLTYVN